MRKRKICVVTGTRAEYGLLYWLMKEIEHDNHLELQLLVTGMHLSSDFGLTYKEIEKDFKIDKKIDMLIKSDTPEGISKSMGYGLIGFGNVYETLRPDLIIVLGDRYEIFVAAISAMIARIPIAHIHGGEVTEGVIDEAIRHSITKMSHLHFVATEEYRKRVIQLGEQPENVYNFGGIGIDNINRLDLLTKSEFEKSIDLKLNKKNILVTFHPVTLENNTSEKQFKELLKAIDELTDTNIIFTKANSDTNGQIINHLIDNYVELNQSKSVVFASMGQLRYLSALKYVDAMVGNSSSGLIEAPTFRIGTINIGNRQRGRIKAESVIDCEPSYDSIKRAFRKLYSNDFRTILNNLNNPYGTGGVSEKIIKVLNNTNFDSLIMKSFFNLEVKY